MHSFPQGGGGEGEGGGGNGGGIMTAKYWFTVQDTSPRHCLCGLCSEMPLNMGNFSALWSTGRKTNIGTLIKNYCLCSEMPVNMGNTGIKTNIETLIKTTA